ncbi:MAG TPA: hypothetical protein VGP93_19565 [Polyangiaceae bacterium]|nr:hypothetical protein [Polyangiaceae bacterium]
MAAAIGFAAMIYSLGVAFFSNSYGGLEGVQTRVSIAALCAGFVVAVVLAFKRSADPTACALVAASSYFWLAIQSVDEGGFRGFSFWFGAAGMLYMVAQCGGVGARILLDKLKAKGAEPKAAP